MSVGERIAFEEIYRLHLRGDGKRERKTRRICEEMLGSQACANLRAADAAAKQRAAFDSVKSETDQ